MFSPLRRREFERRQAARLMRQRGQSFIAGAPPELQSVVQAPLVVLAQPAARLPRGPASLRSAPWVRPMGQVDGSRIRRDDAWKR